MLKEPSTVLIFIDWFYPAYKAGGPIKSVLNIINTLSDQVNIRVITSNHDVDGAILSLAPNTWIAKEKYSICYLNDQLSILDFLKRERIAYNIVYFNSMFSIKFTILPLMYFRKYGMKKIVAPRGMLGKGALAIKPIKKTVFLKLAKYRLFKNIIWHTSTNQESEEVKNVFGENAKTFVAQNISSAAEKRILKDGFKKEDELKLVFISRVSEKKNLVYLLELLSSLKYLRNLQLDIFGPIEGENYWQQCLIQIGKDERVSYKGILSPDKVNETLKQYQFYVLPSFNENYGHSIVEAINIGVPVIISDQTPWRGLEGKKVGFDLSLKNDSIWHEKIEYAYSMSDVEYKKWSQECYVFANKTFINKSIINRNIDLFLSN